MSFLITFSLTLSLVLFFLAIWPFAIASQFWYNRFIAGGLFFFVVAEILGHYSNLYIK